MNNFDESLVRRNVLGRFAGLVHGRAARSLADSFEDGRADALERGGFVKATSLIDADDPRDTEQIDAFWANHLAINEYDPRGAGLPTMEDDFSATRGDSKLGGRSLEGNRRVSRMLYGDESGIQVRMPSKTACRAKFAEVGTFKVPITAIAPNGRTITGWMAVTNNEPHGWAVRPIGFKEGGAEIAEVIASSFEGRRPAQNPEFIGSFIEQRKEAREAAAGIPAAPVQSSWIGKVGYNRASGVMVTVSKKGEAYGHKVSPEVFMAVAHSGSVGRAWSQEIKGLPRVELESCMKCNRYINGEHRCKAETKPNAEPKRTNLVQMEVARALARQHHRDTF